MTPEQIETLLAELDDTEIEALMRDWPLWARPAQIPPVGDWTTWLMIGGRGSGKTRAGAEWVRALASHGVGPIALVGESMVEAEAVMVAGQSGILRVAAPDERPVQRGNSIHWPNGVEAQLFGAADPERLRGPQFAAAWCDELGKWSHAEAAWDNLQFGLRLGQRPRQLVTTTPRPTKLMKRLLSEPGSVVTRMTTRDNADHLAAAFLSAVVQRYEGSVLGRQELDGELIEDRTDALWTRASFRPDNGEVRGRTVVALDPPATSRRTSDACGIIVAAEAGEGAVVLADLSFSPAPPEAWASRAVAAFRAFEADCILAEVNQGGDMVRAVIAQQDPDVPVREARASRGKWLRAEPVAALYARGRVAHAPGLEALEDEMCAFGANGLSDGHSPDRVDALVWALTELLLAGGRPRVRQV